MNIIYGVSGDGFGHSSRAQRIISHLEKNGHSVLVFTYGRAYEILKNKFETVRVHGIELVFLENKLSYPQTLKNTFPEFIKTIRMFPMIEQRVHAFKPDLFVTDFEPLTAGLAHLHRRPLISVDNQHMLTEIQFSSPRAYWKSFLIARTAIRAYIPNPDYLIVLSFFKSKKVRKNVFLTRPLVRDEVLRLKSVRKNFIAVYLSRENKSLLDILKKIDENFIVYGYNIEKKMGNIIFKKTGVGFLKDLSKAKAVIATAGFSLLSEALYLKKPYFAIPLVAQFEQTANALFLKNSGFGDYSEKPTCAELEHFISHLKMYQKNLDRRKNNLPDTLKVIDGILKNVAKKK